MNKKEQANYDALLKELKVRRALCWTEEVLPDVPIPTEAVTLARGWSFNEHAGRVYRSCSSISSHGTDNDRVTSVQGPIKQYSTKLLALKAMRYKLERLYAKELAEVDAEIELAKSEQS